MEKPHSRVFRSDANDCPLVAPEGDHVLPQRTFQIERLLVIRVILVWLDAPVERASHVLMLRICGNGFASDSCLRNNPRHLVRHEKANPVVFVVAPIRETIIDDLKMHSMQMEHMCRWREVHQSQLDDICAFRNIDDVSAVGSTFALGVQSGRAWPVR